MLRVVSGWALNFAEDEDYTTSPYNLFQYLTTLPVKKGVGFFNYLKMEFSVFQFVPMIEKHWSKQEVVYSKYKN